MKLSPLFCSLFLATSLSFVGLVTAAFDYVDPGFCRDSNGKIAWSINISCASIKSCKEQCIAQEGCAGIHWGNLSTGVVCSGNPICAVYYNEAPVAQIEGTSGSPDSYTCYRYIPDLPAPTKAPIMDGCMVKKEKLGYEKCGNLSKEKCATEVLCDWKKKECVHVCDTKKKKDCKKPTFKGKKICQFQN